MAERLAVDPPNAAWAYTERNVVMCHGMIVGVFDAMIAGRSTNFETEAAFLQLPARPATPIQPQPASLPLPANIQMAQPDLLQPAPVIAPPLRVLSNYIPPAQNDYRDQHDRRSSHDLREGHDSTPYRRDYSSDRARGRSRTRSTRSRSPPRRRHSHEPDHHRDRSRQRWEFGDRRSVSRDDYIHNYRPSGSRSPPRHHARVQYPSPPQLTARRPFPVRTRVPHR